MTAVCVNSIKLCALRVTLLDSLGNVADQANNYAVTNRQSEISWTGDVDKGKDLYYRDGCDNAMAAYKSEPLLKRLNTTIKQYGFEPAVRSLMLGDPIIEDNASNPIGVEQNFQDCPSDAGPPNVALEAWSWSWDCDEQLAATPYWYYLIPLSIWSDDQQLTLSAADIAQPALSGFTRRNLNWGHGPYGGIVRGAAGGPTFETSTGGLALFLTSTPPPAVVCGFGTVTPGS